MIRSTLLSLAFSTAALTSIGLLASSALADTRPLLQEGKQTLHQRVLTTPGCELTDTVGSSGELQPAFTRFYVYERSEVDGREWLKVGPDSYGDTRGWLPADCSVEWKMQLTLAFTNPANRQRLLFFRDRSSLQAILDEFEPSSQVVPLHAALNREEEVPSVLAREPEYFVDLQEQFYLLPILEGEEVFTEAGFRARLLNVASVSKAEDPDPAGNATTSVANTPASQLREFNAGVVFVIDSTISMGPYIERTREAVNKILDRIEAENLNEQVKFGLVSYRDSVESVPELEYISRMYANPMEIDSRQDLMARMNQLHEATVSTPGFEEDAYAGVMQAIDDVDWSQYGARYIVLITDASAIEGDNERSSTGLSADQVRLEAANPGVAIYTLHLKTSSGERFSDHARAEAQYANLSTYAGTNTSLYYPVEAGDVETFGAKVDALAEAITSQVRAAYLGDGAIGSALNAQQPDPDETDPSQQRLLEDASLIGHAMQLAYLGQQTGSTAPPVFQAWISDRDLVQQNRPSTDVRVLLTKSQLSDLSDVVAQILDAANQGLISPTDMFDRLRSVAAAMGADPNKLQQNEATQLAELGLMGEYLEDLPYQSEVLNLDEATWKSWDGLSQERFIRNLSIKLRHYQRYNEDVDRWVSLAEGSDPRDDVYPVPLEMMP
ncbi:VWA domain-containing protein [Halomonas qaidamensis]|uniref:VWA domain-containing protein n=1 Tax=Halomonas qaidamensis TaxID=2866211 RepID=A0ABY6JKW5_9GAMM|nr:MULTISPECIES: vWA domain-containing protein [Halomonas]UYV17983.1 VWA domain-containing protein [Halomonas qaidamensis]